MIDCREWKFFGAQFEHFLNCFHHLTVDFLEIEFRILKLIVEFLNEIKMIQIQSINLVIEAAHIGQMDFLIIRFGDIECFVRTVHLKCLVDIQF